MWGLNSPPDEELFPSESVQKFGQIIGLIAADTLEAGVEAVKLVEVEYEALKPVLTLSDASAKNSTFNEAIHKKDNRAKNNVEDPVSKYSVSGLVTLGGQEHFYWEPHSALAVPGPEKQEKRIFCSE